MLRRLFIPLLISMATTAMGQSDNLSGLTPMRDRGQLLGWEAVGRVDLPNGYCTGALIASDMVLTAAHCVHDRDTGEPVSAEGIVFRAGYANGDQLAARRISKVVSPDGYDATPGIRLSAQMVRKDVAILVLSDPISPVIASPFNLHSNSARGERVSVVSYGRGRENVLSWQRECEVTQRFSGGLMAFDCNVTYGSSGAPVIAREGSARRIISLISAGGDDDAGNPVSYGMSLPDVVTELRQKLRRDSLPRPPSPAWKRVSNGQRNGDTGAKFIRP